MAELWQNLSDTFWTANFWLPANVTWKDIIEKREKDGVFLALPRDLWVVVPMAIFLFLIRLTWERFIATPLGRYFEIHEAAPKQADPNPILEAGYKKYGKRPSDKSFTALAKQLDWSQRTVERWWRRRRTQDKPSEMQRFRETSWRFVFYFGIFWYGLFILWDKPYFWDTRHCWYGYPFQEVGTELYWYYMVELGFYFSLVISLFMDVRRKDFLEMIIHHIATISLLLFSWSDNMVRIGSLILVVHDAVDYWMEGAKLAKYCKFHKLCDTLFVIFAVVWFITRICIYPLRILTSAVLECQKYVGHFYGHFYMSILLVALQVLHVIWFYTILRMVYAYVITGQVDKDERSDTECSESEEEGSTVEKLAENGKEKLVPINGTAERASNGVETRQRRK